MPTLPVFKLPGTKIGVGTFKQEFLQTLSRANVTIWAAYGNTSNDVKVYESLEIPKNRTFIAKMGPGANYRGTVQVGKTYIKTHPEYLNKLEPAKIPCPRASFDWP
eukprot:TRINITY_DN3163_c0_g2_i1.p1 TRINITY_DN3163_c0_g2~~TRINITY_DN3163_c0_g2_i1.p1  ORF type:complete len:106 (-),score=18.23 TRINITY_DN3163_c0_g2_i1:14-331(-)